MNNDLAIAASIAQQIILKFYEEDIHSIMIKDSLIEITFTPISDFLYPRTLQDYIDIALCGYKYEQIHETEPHYQIRTMATYTTIRFYEYKRKKVIK